MTKKETDSILGRKNVLCVPNERNHLLPGFTEYEWVGDGEANTLH
jgi:hypothetical protein